MRKKKILAQKRGLNRLWRATAHVLHDCDEFDTIIPARKPLRGAVMRKLVKRYYKLLDNWGGGWLFCDRPRFRASRKYCLLHDEDGDTLCVYRQE